MLYERGNADLTGFALQLIIRISRMLLIFLIPILSSHSFTLMAQSSTTNSKAKLQVSGIGGVFIKAKDPKFLARWYEDNLGINFGTNLYASFHWRDKDAPDSICSTTLGFFSETSTYFDPSESSIMLNFRVNHLFPLLDSLQKNGVHVFDKREEYEYGKFGWILDPDGNKIELWEPVESGFGDTDISVNKTEGVSGLGGVFFKSKDQKKLAEWYHQHLGIKFYSGSAIFSWLLPDDKSAKGTSVLSIFKESNTYFEPGTKRFMINFRVSNLDGLLKKLRSSEVTVLEKTEDHEYGKFGWIIDPEGNKVELWEARK